jgi:hypothetical protein
MSEPEITIAPEKFYSMSEAAGLLNVSLPTLRKLIAAGVVHRNAVKKQIKGAWLIAAREQCERSAEAEQAPLL